MNVCRILGNYNYSPEGHTRGGARVNSERGNGITKREMEGAEKWGKQRKGREKGDGKGSGGDEEGQRGMLRKGGGGECGEMFGWLP